EAVWVGGTNVVAAYHPSTPFPRSARDDILFVIGRHCCPSGRPCHSERSEEAVWVGGTNIVQRTTRPHRSLAPFGMTFFLSSDAIAVLGRCHSERSEEAVWVGGTHIVHRTTRLHRSRAPLGLTGFVPSGRLAV